MASSNGTINGIFEPFAKYVKDQLEIRRVVVANPIGAELQEFNPTNNPNQISFEAPENVLQEEFFYKGENFQLDKRFDSEVFFAYTVEKQCVIRMMSGVYVI